jgi:hypothetical protein
MKARAGGSPIVLGIPGKSGAKRLGDAPSVRIPESGQHDARRRHSERLNQFFPEQSERNGVEQEHPLAGERDDAALRNEVQQFMNVEIRGAHEASQSSQFDS